MKPVLTGHPRSLVSLALFVLLLGSTHAMAATSPLATDLAALVSQGQAVDTQLAGITLTRENSCTELGSAGTSVADWLAAMDAVYDGVHSAFSVDLETLTSLDELSNLAVSVAGRIQGLSQDLNDIAAVADLIEYDASLAALLRLSDDIGTMADRIGEMADRILIMADNIGVMADRMLVTQQLQSSNVVTTQNSILATQQNAIALSDTLGTLSYDPALANLLTQANALSVSMDLVSLNPLNLSVELARIELEVGAYLNQLLLLHDAATRDSAVVSHCINGDTLTWAGDLSTIHRGLALALETYATQIDQLAPLTSTPILSDATASMLRLSADIGVMSDRIVEMVDRIIVMADNIGAMSTRIVDTQNIQQTNIEFTRASLSAASSTTIGLIASYGL